MEVRLNRKPFRTVPKCILDTKTVDAKKTPFIQNFPQEIPSSIVSFNANFLNDADTHIPFLPVNEIWQREMYQLFQISLRNVLQVSSAKIAGTPSLTRSIRGRL